MDNNRKFYIEKIASDARKRLVEVEIIDKDEKALSMEQLKKIVAFYGGELKIYEQDRETCIEKISEDDYVIHYCGSNNYLQVIHELGHAFLHFDNLEIGKRYRFDGLGIEDAEASLFARAMIMPRTNFEQVVIEYIKGGKYSIQDVANDYKTDYLEVLARGEELNIGN